MILINGKIIATLTRFGNLTAGRKANAIALLHFMFFYLFIVRDRVRGMFLIDRIPEYQKVLSIL
jgi:hypothetical protein